METEAAKASVSSLLAAAHHAEHKQLIQALVRICKNDIEPLLAALKSPTSYIRSAAAEALREIGDARAVEPVSSAFKDEKDSDVLRELVDAAREIGGQRAIESAVEPLIDVLKGDDFFNRQYAAQVLKTLGWQPANDAERAILAITLEEWSEVIRIGPAAVEPLITSLRYEYFTYEAAQALGHIADVRAMKPLLTLATDSRFGEIAIKALEQLLTFSVASTPEDDLHSIAQLKHVFQTGRVVSDLGEADIKEPVDCSQVRHLAQQELIRKGIVSFEAGLPQSASNTDQAIPVAPGTNEIHKIKTPPVTASNGSSVSWQLWNIIIMTVFCGATSLFMGYLAVVVGLPVLYFVIPEIVSRVEAAWTLVIMLASSAVYGLLTGLPICLATRIGRNRSVPVGIVFGILTGIGIYLVFRNLTGSLLAARFFVFTSGVVFSPAVTGWLAVKNGLADRLDRQRVGKVIGHGIAGGWYFGIPTVLVVGVLAGLLFNSWPF